VRSSIYFVYLAISGKFVLSGTGKLPVDRLGRLSENLSSERSRLTSLSG